MTTTTQRKETAAEAFRRIEIEIETLTDLIRQGVDDLAERMKNDPRHWGLVGTLAGMKKCLLDAASSQMGLEPEQLQEMMDMVKLEGEENEI